MPDKTATFETDQVSPKGWTATLTGKGESKWTVEWDESAPSKNTQAIRSGTTIENGFLEVKFKAIFRFR